MTAFLTNSNIPLGSESNDGLRIGPMLSGTQSTSSQIPVVSYDCWGNGLLLAPINSYNITPRGPSTNGNVVAATVGVASNLNLTADNYVTTLQTGNIGNTYVQLDWPRALSVNVLAEVFPAATTITVFGLDAYGVPMQESVTVEAIGTYQMKKAFYVVTSVYCGAAQTAGGTVSLQTTDVFGLPYAITSAGNILGINWGNDSDIGTNQNSLPAGPLFGSVVLPANDPNTIDVTTISANAGSFTQISRNTLGTGTPGTLSITAINNAVSISSTEPTDNGLVTWSVLNNNFLVGQATTAATGIVQVSSTAVQTSSNIFLCFGAAIATANPGYLYVNPATIVPGSNFAITNTGAGAPGGNKINWFIAPNNVSYGISPPLGSLRGGTTFVEAPDVLSNSIILVSYNTLNGTTGILYVTSDQIQPGVGFDIGSSNGGDFSLVNWVILQNELDVTMGTTQLNNGTVTVTTPACQTTSYVMLTYNTPVGVAGTYIYATPADGSFEITSTSNTDDSTVNWAVFEYGFTEPIFTKPLGTFTPADLTTPSNTTGDVRGTYLPSTPANGFNELQFNYIVSGFDNFQNQQASVNLPAGGTPTIPLTQTEITVTEQYGLTQYYTGEPG